MKTPELIDLHQRMKNFAAKVIPEEGFIPTCFSLDKRGETTVSGTPVDWRDKEAVTRATSAIYRKLRDESDAGRLQAYGLLLMDTRNKKGKPGSLIFILESQTGEKVFESVHIEQKFVVQKGTVTWGDLTEVPLRQDDFGVFDRPHPLRLFLRYWFKKDEWLRGEDGFSKVWWDILGFAKEEQFKMLQEADELATCSESEIHEAIQSPHWKKFDIFEISAEPADSLQCLNEFRQWLRSHITQDL